MKQSAIRSLFKKWKPHPYTLLSGILIPIAFPQLAVSPLIFVALTPWLLALRLAPSPKAAFREGVWLSFVMSVFGFFWVARAIHQYGGLPWILCIPLFLIFALFNQIQFLAFGPVYHWFFVGDKGLWKGPLWAKPLAVATLYTAIDWSLPRLFQDTLGHATYNLGLVRQLAAIGGASLITWMIVGIAEVLANFTSQSGRTRRTFTNQIPTLAFVAILLGLAGWELGKINKDLASPRSQVRVAAIQANIGDFLKIAARHGYDGADELVVSTFLRLSNQALQMSPRPDVIVWPETAYPHSFGKSMNPKVQGFEQSVRSFVNENKTLLISGGYDRADGQSFNAVFGLAPNLPPVWYHKSILLPFGEYIPLAGNFKSTFQQLFPTMGFFGHGDGPLVLASPMGDGRELKYSPLVCYEALFPWFTREATQKGTELIVNVTNDSWFGAYGEPHLHMALSTFRSIETRVSQIRSTNTGISAMILPDGSIQGATKVFEEAIVSESAPILNAPKTLYLALGDWFGPFCWAMGILLIAVWSRPFPQALSKK